MNYQKAPPGSKHHITGLDTELQVHTYVYRLWKHKTTVTIYSKTFV